MVGGSLCVSDVIARRCRRLPSRFKDHHLLLRQPLHGWVNDTLPVPCVTCGFLRMCCTCNVVYVCRKTCVLDCWMRHCIVTSPVVALVWATHGLPVVRAPVYRGCPCRDPLGCLRCPGKMASGAERQPFVVVLCWWLWTCYVDVAHTRVILAHLLD